MAPLLINMSQMVDMALATPEYGNINVIALHSLLHILIHELGLSKHQVQFTGAGYNQLLEHIIPTMPQRTLVNVNKYNLPDTIQNLNNRELVPVVNVSVGEEKCLFSVEIKNELSDEKSAAPGFPLAPVHVISIDDIRLLETRVNSIHDMLESTLPDNDTLLAKQDGETENCALLKMWNMINITKRLDATEIGIRKLAELIQQFGPDMNNSNDNYNEVEDNNDQYKDEENLKEHRSNEKRLNSKVSNVCGLDSDENQTFTQDGDENDSSKERKSSITIISNDHEHHSFKEIRSSIAILANDVEIQKEFAKNIKSSFLSFESTFYQTMREIQEMLDAKVDKLCIPPLKQYIVDMLSEFQATLDTFGRSFKLTQDAAGTIIRNVNCVSCRKAVTQKTTEPTNLPKLKSSIKSHLLKDSRIDAGPILDDRFPSSYIIPNSMNLMSGTDGKIYRGMSCLCPHKAISNPNFYDL